MSKSNTEKHTTLNRRQALLLPALAGMGAALAGQAKASDSTGTNAHQGPGNCSTPRSAVANTQYGKVRGYLDGGVFTFKGVPYGQDTGGENRWLPAQAPKPWTGEYPALIYGGNCPQHLHDYKDIESSFLQDWTDGYQSEDMLKLNVWTSSLTGKRPVMVYYHGGGFNFGSAYELSSQDGAQLARFHDVVSVTVNHRLNVLGFLDVSEIGGAAYADSANVGMTDLVASLRWVRDNIANFGGDPNRVMIWGQSGGGSKVATLLSMPSAVGLFHCGAMHSAGPGNHPGVEQSRELARQVMKALGLRADDVASLQKMEWAKLSAAYEATAAKINAGTRGTPTPGVGNAPTIDGRIVPERSLYDVAPAASKNVPIMIGNVSEEGLRSTARDTEAEWQTALARTYGEAKAAALIASMKKAHPEKPIRQLGVCVGSLTWMNRSYTMAKLKYEQHGAPVYQFYFTWQSPMLEHMGAWHTAELAFCFDNTKRAAQGTGNTPEAQALAKKMGTAWANFARTGNPSQPGLVWAPTDATNCQTMVWDNECRMVNYPEAEARKILLS